MLKTTLLTLIITGGLLTTAHADTELTSAQQTEMLVAHNKWRGTVGSPALTWSNGLADTAQAWANSLKNDQACNMTHSRTAGLGENLFWASALMYSDGTSQVQAINAEQVVNDWANERLNYRYNSNSCAKGKACGHYTQVVWKNTSEVGCGKAVCADNSQVWVCNYSPAGNYIGEKPY